jgi:dTDP-glucose 4,6-dehydratase
LISKSITCLSENKKIPIHGDGSYIRDWTYVKDNVSGIIAIIDNGIKNEIFNIASENHMTNLEVISVVLDWFEKDESSLMFVKNRWGQDLRYSISSKKLRDIGWIPEHPAGIYKWF